MGYNKYIYGFVVVILLVAGYFININYHERTAHNAIINNKSAEAISSLKTLSFYHHSEEKRIRYSNILINLYYSLEMKMEALKYAKKLVERNRNNYHANYHLGIYFWNLSDIKSSNYYLQNASIYPAYLNTYYRFLQWKEAKENTFSNVMKDIIVPSSLLDLIPISKFKKLSKLSKLTKLGRSTKKIKPPRHVSSQSLTQKKLSKYKDCLKKYSFSKDCDALLE